MANDIDILMSEDPLNLTKEDIDSIITFHRQRRHDFEGGVKPKPERNKPQVKISLQDLGLLPPPEPIKRRI